MTWRQKIGCLNAVVTVIVKMAFKPVLTAAQTIESISDLIHEKGG